MRTLGWMVVLACGACDGALPASDTCSTGSLWRGGDEESPLMHPGGDCIACHTQRGEGPRFSVAGTVHGDLNDPTDCNGVRGVEVFVVDANDREVRLTTNAAGNFYTQDRDLVAPFRPRIVVGGETREMLTEAPHGDCNACHTELGANGAPGRVAQVP